MLSFVSSMKDTAIGWFSTGESRRGQESGSKASVADSMSRAAGTPGIARSSQCRKRSFVLDGTSTRILGFDVPWDDDDSASEVQVSAPLLKLPFTRRYRGDEMERFVAEKRRIAWGIVQIARSGIETEQVLFRSGGREKSFTLRPPTRTNIPLQWTHIGCGAIPNDLADVRCEAMTAGGLLDHLNDVMGTNVSLDIPGLSDFLDEICHTSRDFGVAYGKVRARWARAWQDPLKALSGIKHYQRKVEGVEWELYNVRRKCADAFSIGKSNIPPRRVWDLYSNRVLPYGIVSATESITVEQLPYALWTVSHSWVAAEDRESIWTPINGNQWPVPVPRATTLEHVRIELLNMGAEYAWLDVLCLRQQGRHEDEAVRIEEWKVDVPTIGYVYRESSQYRPCATYFNGLGLPLDTASDALASRTHWLNRVWTLQETLSSFIPCGLTGLPPPADSSITTLFSRHAALLQKPNRRQGRQNPDGRQGLPMQELQRRSCTSELDRIAGLAYIVNCKTLPVYRPGADVEGAWQQLLKHAPEFWRMDVMCMHPAGAPFALFPSWDAYVSAGPAFCLPTSCRGLELFNTESRSSEEPGRYCHWGKVLGPCKVIRAPAARGGVQSRLTVRLDPGKSAEARTLAARGAHGVLLEGIDYQLVIIDDLEAFVDLWGKPRPKLCVAVEVVGESEISKRRFLMVEAIKWAVLEVRIGEIDGFKSSSGEVRKDAQITYLPAEEALRRTSYKERYLKAFRVMTERKHTLIVAK